MRRQFNLEAFRKYKALLNNAITETTEKLEESRKLDTDIISYRTYKLENKLNLLVAKFNNHNKLLAA